jgi:hypothetical protein
VPECGNFIGRRLAFTRNVEHFEVLVWNKEGKWNCRRGSAANPLTDTGGFLCSIAPVTSPVLRDAIYK